jgi:hypothetical protein
LRQEENVCRYTINDSVFDNDTLLLHRFFAVENMDSPPARSASKLLPLDFFKKKEKKGKDEMAIPWPQIFSRQVVMR